MLMVWRKDLVHRNKTRDNHVLGFARHFDLTLMVREDAEIGAHVEESVSKIVRIPGKETIGGLLGFYSRVSRWVAKEHRTNPFDVIVAATGEEVSGARLRRRLPGSTLIFDLWDVPAATISSRRLSARSIARDLMYSQVRRSLRVGDAVIAGVMPEALRPFVPEDARLINSVNGIDPGLFVQEPERADNPAWKGMKGDLRILYSGFVAEARGSIDLVRAVARATEEGRSWSLVLAGPCSDIDRIAIDTEVHALDVEGRVRAIGAIDSADVPSLVASADVCVSPLHDIEQFRWTYPVKILEYLAIGRPVVASDLPGQRKCLPEGLGRFHVPEDIDSLVDAIRDVEDSPELADSVLADAPGFISRFRWSDILDRICFEIKEVIDDSKGCEQDWRINQ